MPTPNAKRTPASASPPKSEAEQQADFEPEVTTEEMRDAFMRQLYDQRHGLKGVALVQALKALESLLTKEQQQPEKAEDIPPHSLLDQVGSLPAAHSIVLVETEIARLDAERAAHVEALEKLKGK